MRDTIAHAESVQAAALRRMHPVERIRQALEFSEWVRGMALAQLRRDHPGLSDLELVELIHGRALVPRVTRSPGP